MFRIKIQKSKIHPFSFDVFLLNDDIDPNKYVFNDLSSKLDTSYPSRTEEYNYLKKHRNIIRITDFHLCIWSLKQNSRIFNESIQWTFKNTLHETDFTFKVIGFTETWCDNDGVRNYLYSLDNNTNIHQVGNY